MTDRDLSTTTTFARTTFARDANTLCFASSLDLAQNYYDRNCNRLQLQGNFGNAWVILKPLALHTRGSDIHNWLAAASPMLSRHMAQMSRR